MKYVIFGLPGSGKGLYSNYIEDITGAKQLSTGDLLRKMKKEDMTEIGEELRKLGPTDFASDEIIIQAIKKELQNEIYANGVIFDGFPRTLIQAEKMIELDIIPDAIISVECPEKVISDRITGRRIHPQSGRIYHTTNKPPKVEGYDDETGEPLIIREDDKPELLSKRFEDFNQKTKPAFEFLKAKCKNGSGPVFTKISGEITPQEAYEELKITTGSIRAIHKIRELHSFTLIISPYDLDNKEKNDILLREALHQSLMNGEVPFSPEIFYFQKNMLDPQKIEHRETVKEITDHILNKSHKLIVVTKNENDKDKTLKSTNVMGKDIYLSKENLLVILKAKKLNKEISFVQENELIPQVDKYNDHSIPFKISSSIIDSGEIIQKLKNSNPLLTEILSPETNFVIIESPYAGNKEEILRNENYARSAALDCLSKGEIPFASHILYTQKGILDDTKPAQRRLGIEAGLTFGEICQKSVLYSDLGMTEGMVEGIEKAKKSGRGVEIRQVDTFQDLYKKALNKRNKNLKP